jgi:arylsulfatase A-like enzyme
VELRTLCGCAIGLALWLALGCGPARPERPRANLLLVILDTTRADRLGCYGWAPAATPELDALAHAGARFEAAYATSTLTPISSASILTGTWPWRHGVRTLFYSGGQTLSPGVPSLFGELREAGWRTAAFVSAWTIGSQYGLDRGFELYDDDMSAAGRSLGLAEPERLPQRPADATVDRAVEWLERNGREPFAVLLHLFDVHDRVVLPPREFLDARLGLERPEGVDRVALREQWPGIFEAPGLVRAYEIELEFASAQLGRLLSTLDGVGLREDTLVCVVADHGEALGERGFFSHGLLYEEQLRVPLILQGPGVPPGSVVGERIQLVDLAPTLLELLGQLGDPAAFDGRSLVGALSGSSGVPQPDARALLAEVRNAPGDRLGRPAEQYAVREGSWE